MWMVLWLLLGIPKVLFHFFLTSILLMVFLCYKLFGTQQVASISRAQLQEQFQRRQHLILSRGGRLRDKIKSAIMNRTREDADFAQREAGLVHTSNQRVATNPGRYNVYSNINSRQGTQSRCFLASLVVIYVLLVASPLAIQVECLEQDAAILEPVANMAKSIIRTVTLGVPLQLNIEPSALVKNFAYFTWRTGFPVTMPKGFIQKTQDFYNRIKARVDRAEVADVQRKSLANLKLDLDLIVESIVEEVRQSKDGLYTDYLQTRVDGVPLEDACTAVGIQLKAYGVDLTNYRNIAGAVLGVPMMPTVASAMVNVAGFANMKTVRNLTSTLNPLNSSQFLTQLPSSALHSVSMVSNSIGNLGHQLPMQNVVQAPFALLSSGQRLFMPSRVEDAQPRQPVFA